MKKVKEILDSLASPTQSKWRENAEFRFNNRYWLQKTHRIALYVLNEIHERNIYKKELAKELGISMIKLNRILSGKLNIDIETICKIEKILNCEIIKINIK